jgi:hypothetical protein
MWSRNLLDLDFSTQDEESGKVEIKTEQLHCILNLDETFLSLDGSNGQQGGRSSSIFHDPSLPHSGTGAAKSSQTLMMITGLNALGEPLWPHFQFRTAEQTEETMHMNVEVFLHTHTKSFANLECQKRSRRHVPLL